MSTSGAISQNRLFNPIKVNCSAAQTHPFWNSTKRHTSLSYSPRVRFWIENITKHKWLWKYPLKPTWHIFPCPVICDSSVAVQNRILQNAMRAIPQFHGIDGWFLLLCGIPIVAPYHILLSIGPTCPHGKENHSWLWQCVARNASDHTTVLGPLIHNHTTFKCFIAFSNIITSCDMPTCIMFIIPLFCNAVCLIICLSEHRTFAFRLVLNAHWSVTN